MPAPRHAVQVLVNVRNQPVEVHLADGVVVIGPGGSAEVDAGTTGQLEELLRRGLVTVAGDEGDEGGPGGSAEGRGGGDSEETGADKPARRQAPPPAPRTSKTSASRRRGSATTTRGGK